MKQIGLGIHNFHDVRNGIPPAAHSWHRITMWAYLWPFMEQSNLYDCIGDDPVTLGQFFWNTSGGWGGVTLTAEQKKGFSSVPYMVCPSRRSTPAAYEYSTADSGGSATAGPQTDYAMVMSTDAGDYPATKRTSGSTPDSHYYVRVCRTLGGEEWQQNFQRGAFRGARLTTPNSESNNKDNPRDNFSRITDGLSNQFLIGEKHIPIDGLNVCNYANPSTNNWSQCHDCSYLSMNAHTDGGQTIRSLVTHWSADHKTPYSNLANGIDGPYDHLAANGNATINCGFGSWHASGANFLMGDGSVRFFGSTTAHTILGKYATVDDGLTPEN